MQTISIWNEEDVYKLDDYTAIIELARFRGFKVIQLTIDVKEMKATPVSLQLLTDALTIKYKLKHAYWNYYTYNTSIHGEKVQSQQGYRTGDSYFREFNDNLETVRSWASETDPLLTFVKGDPSLLTPECTYGDIYFSYYVVIHL